ncbi:hypothetical protein NE848_04020 [Gramella jeungdoensis]|uniref:DUF4190 domain-containing protein n=1 Tax=Gramella jeungdoensis TaxID=708091 RepID=A0ABT0YZT0_9FLAO|nr:hypothetical protein [Gramella jeungdoensis]MCM8568530.1 hypothetical protein [Gramella jeungdoensis]
MTTENHNLNVFKVLFLIKGIFTILISFFPLIYIFMGMFIFNNEMQDHDHFGLTGLVFMVVGTVIFLFLMALGIVTILAGKFIGERRRYDFIFVIAVLNCFTGILGILLGIFTIIELVKPQVKQLFGKPV